MLRGYKSVWIPLHDAASGWWQSTSWTEKLESLVQWRCLLRESVRNTETPRDTHMHTHTFFHTHFLIWVLCRLAPCPNKQMFVQVPGLCCWLPVPSVGRQAIITVTWQMLGKRAVENWTHASYESGGCWTLNTQVFPARLAHCISLAYRNRVQLAASFVHMCQQLELRLTCLCKDAQGVQFSEGLLPHCINLPYVHDCRSMERFYQQRFFRGSVRLKSTTHWIRRYSSSREVFS